MTEELEQLLKNLKLRRMLSVYDEQLRAAEKAQVSYSEFVSGCCVRNGTTGRKVRWSGASASQSAGALVAGIVSLVAPAG